MKVKFGEFLKDLRTNKGLTLRHPAWLSVDLLATKQVKSFLFFEN